MTSEQRAASPRSGPPGIAYGWAFVALGTILAASLVAHGWRAYRRAEDLRSSKPAPGSIMPVLTVGDLDGHLRTIEYGENDRPTVFYVFSPDCVWCERNSSNLETLVEATRGEYRFVGLSLTRNPEPVRRYVAEQGIGFPVYVRASTPAGAAFRFDQTPLTVVVSTGGAVLRSWVGAYTGDELREIEAYFGVRLPGLSPAKPRLGSADPRPRQTPRPPGDRGAG